MLPRGGARQQQWYSWHATKDVTKKAQWAMEVGGPVCQEGWLLVLQEGLRTSGRVEG